MRRIGSGVLAWILAVAMFLEPAACAVVSAQEPVLTQEEQADGKEGLTEEPGTEENEGQEEEKKEPEEDGEDAAEEEQDSQPEDEENNTPEEENGEENAETGEEERRADEESTEDDTQTLSGNSVSENTVTAEDGELQTGYCDDPDALYQAGSFDVVIETPEDNYSAMDAEAQSLRDEAIQAIYEGLRDKKEKIDVSAYGFTKSDLATFQAVYYGVVNDHPEFYYVKTAYRYWSYSSGEIVSVEPQYMDYDFDDEAFQQATQEAMSLIDDDMTEVEKALVLHDYIAVTCAYDYDNYKAGTLPEMVYNSYGALVERSAVCQGYALAYKYLLGQAGIQAYMVSSKSMNHAWNIVRLDGEYYQADVTWDDPTSDRIGRARHYYMFISDTAFKNSRKHYGWTVTTASEETDITATNTQYDDVFWTNCDAQITVQDHKYYYVDGKDATKIGIRVRDYAGESIDTLTTIPYWTVWNSRGWWNGAYTGLSQLDDMLVYNDKENIYAINRDGTGKKVLFAPDITEGYIYGSYCEDDTLFYILAQSPNEEGKSYYTELTFEDTEIESITLDQTELVLDEKGTSALKATIKPARANKSALHWTSSNSGVATVTAEDGSLEAKITAVKEGSCTIKVSDGTHEASCEVTVCKKLDKPVFTPAEGYVDKGDTVTITAEDGADIYYTTEGSDPRTADGHKYTKPIPVDDTLTIYAVAVKGGSVDSDIASASFVPCTNNLILNKTEMTLKQGDREKIRIVELPTSKGEPDVNWSSEDENIADVDGGIVTGLTAGTTTITATVEDHKGRKVTATCKVTVHGQLAPPVFSLESGYVDKGDTVTITAKDGADIYYLIGEDDPVSKGMKYTGPITIDKDMTITAVAVKDTYLNSERAIAEYKVGSNEFTLEQTAITLTKGERQKISITALPTATEESEVQWSSDHKEIATVEQGTVTAVSAGTATITASVEDYKGREVTANCEITVNPKMFTVSFYSATGVLIEEQQVEEGTDAVPPTKVPEYPGKIFSGWDGDYTKVVQDMDIRARYTLRTYQITYVLDAGEHPNISDKGTNPDSYTVEDDLVFQDATGSGDFEFAGWYETSDYSGEAVTGYTAGHTGDITLYAKWRDGRGLRMEYTDADGTIRTSIGEQTYTGAAIKPEIRVYNGADLLTPGKDYKITYKNNKAAYELGSQEEGFKATKAPSVIIQGVGNYTGKITEYFVIRKKDLADEDISAENLLVSYNNGMNVKVAPAVKWNEKALKNKTEYTWQYAPDELEAGAGKKPGQWTITLTGAGNFTGSREITLTITERILLSKCKVKIADQPYEEGKEGEEVVKVSLSPEDIKLTCGRTVLTEKDYDFKILDEEMKIGTHQVVLTGKGDYEGTLKTSFKITGQTLKGAKIEGVKDLVYCGDAEEIETKQKKNLIVYTAKKVELTEGTDYEVTFSKTESAGTAKLTVTGIGGYTGTVSKSFKIKPYDVKENGQEYLDVVFEEGTETFPYAKGGVKPKVSVTFRGEELIEGTDYRVSYQNNKAVTTENTKKVPKVVITGKKNLTKTYILPFEIEKQDFSKVSISAVDVTVNLRPGKYYSTPVLVDPDGTKLKAGTDYSKSYVYKDEDGNILDKTACPKAGDRITVIVSPAGSYEGEAISTTYRVLEKNKDISKAKATVKGKIYYNGSKVTLKEKDITLTLNRETLDPENYVIIGYQLNDRKGKATAIIQGKESKGYGGIKKVTFSILPQTMSWK